eukprot:gene11613-15551_t
MLNKAKKLAKRVGCLNNKILFSINVVCLHFPKQSNLISDGALLSVCFERGGKIASTKNKPFSDDNCTTINDEILFSIQEKIELVATLYKDIKTNDYQKKKGKLMLRQLKKNMFGSDAYAGIGLFSLELDKLAVDLGFEVTMNKTLSLPLDIQGFKCSLDIIATITLLRSSIDPEETMSMNSVLSDTSDMSAIGATFEPDPKSQSAPSSATKHTPSSAIASSISRGFFSTGKKKKSKYKSSSASMIMEKSIDEDDNLVQNLSSGSIDISDIYTESESEKVTPFYVKGQYDSMQQIDKGDKVRRTSNGALRANSSIRNSEKPELRSKRIKQSSAMTDRVSTIQELSDSSDNENKFPSPALNKNHDSFSWRNSTKEGSVIRALALSAALSMSPEPNNNSNNINNNNNGKPSETPTPMILSKVSVDSQSNSSITATRTNNNIFKEMILSPGSRLDFSEIHAESETVDKVALYHIKEEFLEYHLRKKEREIILSRVHNSNEIDTTVNNLFPTDDLQENNQTNNITAGVEENDDKSLKPNEAIDSTYHNSNNNADSQPAHVVAAIDTILNENENIIAPTDPNYASPLAASARSQRSYSNASERLSETNGKTASSRLRRYKANKEDLRYFKGELDQKTNKINRLEAELKELIERHQLELLSLRSDLAIVKEELSAEQKEHQALALFERCSITADDKLLEVLAMTRNENSILTRNYAK